MQQRFDGKVVLPLRIVVMTNILGVFYFLSKRWSSLEVLPSSHIETDISQITYLDYVLKQRYRMLKILKINNLKPKKRN